MSDDPKKLKAILLQDADDSVKKQFAEMLADQCAMADLKAKGHKCWFYVPPPQALERMKKYNQSPEWDKCPKCGKGRVVVEIHHGNLGVSLTFKCYFNKNGCDFEEECDWDI